jgi:hypothetical protein
MTRMMNALAAGATLLVASGTSGGAQTGEPWRFTITPYAWMAGLDGQVGVRNVAGDVDIGFSDILRKLRFAAMAYGEARRGPYVLGMDALYVSLEDGHGTAFRGGSGSVNLAQKQLVLQPLAGYTLGDQLWGVDFVVGARYWNLNADLDVESSRRPESERSDTRSWVDAIGGLRFHLMPIGDVRFTGSVDGGGGGARSTWQGYASLGLDLTASWTAALAYRSLAVDYDHNNFLYNTTTRGVALVVTYRF